MLSIKRLSVALIALGLSAPVLAANNSVCIPSQHGGFKIGVDALYLRKNVAISGTDSSYNWGMYAQVGYLFPATANDLTVDYTYLRGDKSAQDSLDVDSIDLEGGQRLTTGAFDIRLFAGIRYTNLAYGLSMGSDEDTISATSKFHGFGPRFGADTRYQLGNCFGLDAHVNTALLVGKVKNNYQDQKITQSESIQQVLPEVGAKLGVDYTSPVSFDNKSAFVFEVGYQTTHHFHALSNSLSGNSSDVSFDGPYIDVKYYA